MTTSTNKFDALENLLYAEGLPIEATGFHRGRDSFPVNLTAKNVLH